MVIGGETVKEVDGLVVTALEVEVGMIGVSTMSGSTLKYCITRSTPLLPIERVCSPYSRGEDVNNTTAALGVAVDRAEIDVGEPLSMAYQEF